MQIALSAGSYIHWGVLNISVTNALIILAMVAVFVLAILVPFPRPDAVDEEERTQP